MSYSHTKHTTRKTHLMSVLYQQNLLIDYLVW